MNKPPPPSDSNEAGASYNQDRHIGVGGNIEDSVVIPGDCNVVGVLYSNGYSPWNYAQFLNHCTDRLLLQRVGGRYRFMHKLLQEHFAAMPLK